MGFDKSAFQRAEVTKDATAIFEFNGLDLGADEAPWIRVRYAGVQNKAYTNARIASFKRGRRRVDADSILSDLREDREPFARYVVTEWGNILDDQKQPVVFNADACKEFLDLLPDYMFEDLRAFAQDPTNFAAGFQIDTGTVAKN